jgi:hypothetical protein
MTIYNLLTDKETIKEGNHIRLNDPLIESGMLEFVDNGGLADDTDRDNLTVYDKNARYKIITPTIGLVKN